MIRFFRLKWAPPPSVVLKRQAYKRTKDKATDTISERKGKEKKSMDPELKLFLEKRARRALLKDFLGGVEPTGTLTYRYGSEDVDDPKARPGLRRAIGTAGGAMGGAVAIPSAVSGVIGLGKGVLGLRKGRGLRHLARSGWRGLKQPISTVYHGTKAKRMLEELKRRQMEGWRTHFARPRPDPNRIPPRKLVKDLKKSLSALEGRKVRRLPMTRWGQRALQEKLQTKVKGELTGMGMAGGLSGLGSHQQYGTGRDVMKQLKEKQSSVPALLRAFQLTKRGWNG